MIKDYLKDLSDELNRADELCVPNDAKANGLSLLIKSIYDLTRTMHGAKFGPLDHLVVDGLDSESIWEELQTSNKPVLRFLTRKALKMANKKPKTDSNIELEFKANHVRSKPDENFVSDSTSEQSRSIANEEEYEANNDESDEDNNSDNSDGNSLEYDSDDFDAEDDEDEMEMIRDALYGNEDEEEDDDNVNDEPASYMYSDFFRVSNRINKLKNVTSDVANNLNDNDENDESDFDEERDDYVDSDSDNNGLDDEEEDDDNDVGDESVNSDNNSESKSEAGGDNNDEEEDDDDSNSNNKLNKKILTTHQKHKQRMSQHIAELEQQLIQEKSWEYKGEIKAKDRPENSLLGISADIERSSKPAPVITQEHTSSLEDLIKKRIKDEIFNDVQLQVKEKTARSEAPELSQEKSQQGLGEIYAEAFLAKTLNTEPEAVSKKLQLQRDEALELYQKISRELDSLSHFYFTPKPILNEAKLNAISTQPTVSSISLEEMVPIFESNATALAPEEILNKKRGREAALLAEAELTREDKKRLRRASKQVNKNKKKDEKSKESNQSKSKHQRHIDEDKQLTEDLKRDKRVTLQQNGNKNNNSENNDYAKSSTFFANLQRQAQEQISGNNKSKDLKKKKEVSAIGNSKALKL